MVVAQQQTATWRPAPVRPDDDLFVGLAAEVGAQCAPFAAAHDRDNTFVAENYALLRDAGYTRLAIPKEMGGLGATMRQVCYAQAELAKYKVISDGFDAKSDVATHEAEISVTQ